MSPKGLLRALGGRAKHGLFAWLRRRLEGQGYHVIKRHFYSPIPEAEDLPPGYWDNPRAMPGVDLGLAGAVRFIDEVVAPHIGSFRDRFPLRQDPAGQGFYLINGAYMAVDAHVYWCLVNHHRPKRIIEIGAGNSTMVSLEAVSHLKQTTGHECRLSVIEPYPIDFIKDNAGVSLELIQEKVQKIPLDLFGELGNNDILFIDSTHVLREGSDVQYEFLQILPNLADGVLVHVHDVSLPKPYPRAYFDSQLYWNEQYLLQAFLAFNRRFKVVWPGNAMMLAEPAKMMAAFPEIAEMRKTYPSSEPTAFWMISGPGNR